jgi:small-conductance mechanosensitive channel
MSELTVEELQKQLKDSQTALDEAKKGQMSKEDRDRLEFLEGDNKTLIEARDKLKEDKRIATEKKLVEDGEFQTVAENAQKQVTDLAAEIEGLKGKLGSYQERDEKEFKAILENVPEALREQVSDDTLPLEKRLSLARALSTMKGQPPGFRQPGEPTPDSLQAQYDKAVEAGNMVDQLRLKRLLHEAKE